MIATRWTHAPGEPNWRTFLQSQHALTSASWASSSATARSPQYRLSAPTSRGCSSSQNAEKSNSTVDPSFDLPISLCLYPYRRLDRASGFLFRIGEEKGSSPRTTRTDAVSTRPACDCERLIAEAGGRVVARYYDFDGDYPLRDRKSPSAPFSPGHPENQSLADAMSFRTDSRLH